MIELLIGNIAVFVVGVSEISYIGAGGVGMQPADPAVIGFVSYAVGYTWVIIYPLADIARAALAALPRAIRSGYAFGVELDR